MIPCDVTGHSDRPAFAKITWGSYLEQVRGNAHQSGNLCRECSDELWEKVKPLVVNQSHHYVIERPN